MTHLDVCGAEEEDIGISTALMLAIYAATRTIGKIHVLTSEDVDSADRDIQLRDVRIIQVRVHEQTIKQHHMCPLGT